MNGLKYIRAEIMNKTMEELATVIEVSKQAIHAWESGNRKIPETRLKQLSELSGIPQKYFLISELSERDKLEIRKFNLNKELEDTAFEYKEEVQDSMGNWSTATAVHLDTGLLGVIEMNDMNLKVHDTMEKVNKVIYTRNPHLIDEEMASDMDYLNEIDVKRSVFNRFADIVDGNEQMEVLFQILRSMELFFSKNVEKNQVWGEESPFLSDFVSDEKPLIQELYAVLCKHKKQMIQQSKSEIKDLQELGLLADSLKDDD